MNLLGYLSLAFGVLGPLCCCCPWLTGAPLVGGIPAIVLGVLHLQKVKRGQATTPWLGWLGIALGAIALIGAIFSFTFDFGSRFEEQFDNM